MSKRLVRLLLLLTALFTSLTILPMAAMAFAGQGESDVRQGTVPGGTVPTSPIRTPRPTRVPPQPTRAPGQPPAQPPREGRKARVQFRIGQYLVERVIGNRLSSTIYAYTENGALYRSNNNGMTWRLVHARPAVDDFVMSPADPNVLYSGLGCATDEVQPFYISTNGGRNWTEVGGSEDLKPLLAHPADENTLFALGCDGPYVTFDGAATWETAADFSDEALWDIYGIVEMADSPMATSLSDPNWDVVYAAGNGEDGSSVVAFTQDSGASWERLSPDADPAPVGVTAVAADPYIAGRLWVADSQGVWYTEDYGANWELLDEGLEGVVGRGKSRITDLVFHTSGDLYVGTAMGLFVKRYDSDSFEAVRGEDFGRPAVDSMLLTESNLRNLWLNTPNGVFIYRTE